MINVLEALQALYGRKISLEFDIFDYIETY